MYYLTLFFFNFHFEIIIDVKGSSNSEILCNYRAISI